MTHHRFRNPSGPRPVRSRGGGAPLVLATATFALLMIALTGNSAGCAGPLEAESRAFDRWIEHDERAYGARHADAAAREAVSPATQAFELPEQPVLEDYLRYALAHNPGLKAAFEQWKAALERIAQARALPDAQLSYSYFVRESMTQQTAGLTQTFPWYGKLKASAEANLEAARAAEQRFETRRRALIAEVKEAYAEYAHLRQALDVMAENRRILHSLEASARARFEAGDVPYADVVRAEVAVERIEDEIAAMEDRRSPLIARLNTAMGRQSRAALPWPEPLAQPTVAMDERALLDRLAHENPELQALEHETARQRQELRLARQNRIPDLMLGVEYMDMVTMRDQVALMGRINLPIWGGRLDAERAEALAEFGAATHERTDRENELQSALRLAHYRFRDAHRRAELFEQRLIPMAREALEASEAAYAADEAEFQALTQAQRDLQEMQLTYQRALADRFQHLAELERLVGSDLAAESNATNGDVGAHDPADDGE